VDWVKSNLYPAYSSHFISVGLAVDMLEAFTSALVLITSQELGDKTFFIALILAMRYPRRWVFLGAIAALALMTVISVGAGHLLSFLPAYITRWVFVVLCFGFGLWLCWQASQMNKADEQEPLKAATEEVREFKFHQKNGLKESLQRNIPWRIVWETATLTFVAEWGDRTQLATIALALHHNAIGVIVGGIAGHTICALIAVLGGRWAAGRISERLVTWIGGLLFILFGAIALFAEVTTTQP
jgi:Ca2+/H+ antiporter, TMEM165/GDT1 family